MSTYPETGNTNNNTMDSVVRISMNGRVDAFPKGILLGDAVERLLPEIAERVLCALRGGICVELGEAIEEDSVFTALTYQDEEGRRVYERSLRFLLLASMNRLYPGQDIRVLNSVGYGVYMELSEGEFTHEMTRALEDDMRSLVMEDLPFKKEIWPIERAIEYFREKGWKDKEEILKYRPYPQIAMYRMGGLCEYFYGAMLPSSRYIQTFALKPHFPGMVLQMPSPEAPYVPAPYVPRPKHLRVFTQSQKWCNILGANNAADVNHMIETGRFHEFIRVNEALHDKSIALIADEIVARNARIVMVFGPSSSGKTTFTNRLAVHLRVLGKRSHILSLDDFYRNRDELENPNDLEHIDTLDIPYLNECLEKLLSGHTAQMPHFDFTVSKRSAKTHEMRIASDEMLLVEGIHGLNDKITSEIPEQLMYGVYVSALSCINLDDHNRIRTTDVRLLRRIVRDNILRNTTPTETIQRWPSVREGEEKWIFPNQEKADIMFNTSLHYELPVLKASAYDLLCAIESDRPEYLTARRLIKILHYFLPAEGDMLREIPPLSILREFIGDCAFYTERG